MLVYSCTWHKIIRNAFAWHCINVIFEITVLCAVEEVIIALVRLYQEYSFELDDKLLKETLEFGPGMLVSPSHDQAALTPSFCVLCVSN